MQNQKSHEEDQRRANSYHSFSQSPPYDYQYEERRNGKQSAMLTRKPGSDRGHDGKMSGFAYSAHSLHERMSEDRFANESCGSRTSDCSGSSMSDMFKTAPQSPNFLDNGCFSPVQPDQTNIHTSSGITQSQVVRMPFLKITNFPFLLHLMKLFNNFKPLHAENCINREHRFDIS